MEETACQDFDIKFQYEGEVCRVDVSWPVANAATIPSNMMRLQALFKVLFARKLHGIGAYDRPRKFLYTDEDGDLVRVSSDDELQKAMSLACLIKLEGSLPRLKFLVLDGEAQVYDAANQTKLPIAFMQPARGPSTCEGARALHIACANEARTSIIRASKKAPRRSLVHRADRAAKLKACLQQRGMKEERGTRQQVSGCFCAHPSSSVCTCSAEFDADCRMRMRKGRTEFSSLNSSAACIFCLSPCSESVFAVSDGTLPTVDKVHDDELSSATTQESRSYEAPPTRRGVEESVHPRECSAKLGPIAQLSGKTVESAEITVAEGSNMAQIERIHSGRTSNDSRGQTGKKRKIIAEAFSFAAAEVGLMKRGLKRLQENEPISAALAVASADKKRRSFISLLRERAELLAQGFPPHQF